MMTRIYLDNAATTQMDKRVLDAMMPYFTDYYGNPSSLHFKGSQAREALEQSRRVIANCIGALPEEIVFTSGGTEANNLAIKGAAFANRSRGNHIIVSAIEHDCVMNAVKWLEHQGFFITYLPVDKCGLVDPDYFRRLIGPKTIMASVMSANNEIGTIEPVDEIGRICKESGILFHSDACQSFGKVVVDVNGLVNAVMRMKDGRYKVRIEGLFIG